MTPKIFPRGSKVKLGGRDPPKNFFSKSEDVGEIMQNYYKSDHQIPCSLSVLASVISGSIFGLSSPTVMGTLHYIHTIRFNEMIIN